MKILKRLILLTTLTPVLANAGGGNLPETGTITVSAITALSCTVIDSIMNFGPYNGSWTTGDATVLITCSGDVSEPLKLTINNGANESSGQRRLLCSVSTPSYLNYNIYPDSLTSSPWTVESITPTSTPITVYGRIPAGEPIVANGLTCTDTLTLTLDF